MRHLDFDRAVDRVLDNQAEDSGWAPGGTRRNTRAAFFRLIFEPRRPPPRPLPAEMRQVLDELAAKDDARRRAALASAWKPETVRRGR